MRPLAKNIYNRLPVFIKSWFLLLIEKYYRAQMFRKEKALNIKKNNIQTNKTKKRVLIYHINGLYYAGTEKCLQIIAEALSTDYEVYFMHATDETKPNRRKDVEKFCTIIDFKYESVESAYPHYINGMQPHIKNIISEYGIDLIVSAGTGKTEYPLITITDIPIIMTNVFGAPTMQENIKKIIFVSHDMQKHSERYTGLSKNNTQLYIPVSTTQTKEGVEDLREKFNIPKTDFIFGRIGRDTDSIFDPIGILAFEKLVKENKVVHYIIVSPSPALIKIVNQNKIPNVHFLPPTAKDEEVWSFHYSIDALAHFRFDGETYGLNITESMHAGKPILTHKSHIWNSHLEYLEPAFSMVADRDNVEQYYQNMKKFVMLHSSNKPAWNSMCLAAKTKADLCFSKANYSQNIRNIAHQILL